MIFPITTSDTPLEFDALPALKCTCWQTGSHRVHTLARMYVQGGALRLSLCAFEREPAPESAMGFALAGAGRQVLFAGLDPAAAWLLSFPATPSPLPGQTAPAASESLAVERFSGVDEQGWYWGARLTLPGQALAQAGCTAQPGSTFRAGLLKYGTGPLGSSYRPADPEKPLDATSLDEFLVVDY